MPILNFRFAAALLSALLRICCDRSTWHGCATWRTRLLELTGRVQQKGHEQPGPRRAFWRQRRGRPKPTTELSGFPPRAQAAPAHRRRWCGRAMALAPLLPLPPLLPGHHSPFRPRRGACHRGAAGKAGSGFRSSPGTGCACRVGLGSGGPSTAGAAPAKPGGPAHARSAARPCRAQRPSCPTSFSTGHGQVRGLGDCRSFAEGKKATGKTARA